MGLQLTKSKLCRWDILIGNEVYVLEMGVIHWEWDHWEQKRYTPSLYTLNTILKFFTSLELNLTYALRFVQKKFDCESGSATYSIFTILIL